MYVGAPDPRDEIFLAGDPPVHLLFEGGIFGDSATAAIVVNSVRQVVERSPGPAHHPRRRPAAPRSLADSWP
jgi:4-hydroxy-tetrahydrodipicolinate reductase